MKSFTNLKQSRKLAEILPTESADMEYLLEQWIDEKTGHHKEGYYEIPVVKVDDNSPLQQITHPCWSLAALLNLMVCPNLEEYIKNKWDLIAFTDKSLETPVEVQDCESAVDACYEMIIRLNELKKL